MTKSEPSGDAVQVSMVLPAFNEEGVIAASIRAVDSALRDLGRSYEVLVGDDGSSDRTAEIAASLGLSAVRVITRPHRGKGAILTDSLLESRGVYAGFIDSDLEIDVRYLPEMVQFLDEGYDAAIASKVAPGPAGGRRRPWTRRLSTRVYNLLVRTLFRTGIGDHQAGFKLFRGFHIRALLGDVQAPGWLWDTEVLVALIREGGRVKEIPVITSGRDESRVRLLGTSLEMLGSLSGLYLRTLRSSAAGPTAEPGAEGVQEQARRTLSPKE